MTRDDGDDVKRMAAAFPVSMQIAARGAIATMPQGGAFVPGWSKLTEDSTRSRRMDVRPTVAGEPVEIPYRIYHESRLPGEVTADLSPVQRTILGCLFTRHSDGFVRQAWLREIIGETYPWVVPFVVQLAAEYVVEILDDIRRLGRLDDPASPQSAQYRLFFAENPRFLELTRQRIISYRHCFYPAVPDYPGAALLSSFDALTC